MPLILTAIFSPETKDYWDLDRELSTGRIFTFSPVTRIQGLVIYNRDWSFPSYLFWFEPFATLREQQDNFVHSNETHCSRERNWTAWKIIEEYVTEHEELRMSSREGSCVWRLHCERSGEAVDYACWILNSTATGREGRRKTAFLVFCFVCLQATAT